MTSPHQCEHCAVFGKAEFGRCGSQPQPPEFRECGDTPQSSVEDVDMMKAGEKDRSKLDYCVLDTTSTICWQCHTWLCKRKFEEHVVIAVENVQDGSLLHTSEVRNLMRCEERGCQLCSTVLASIRLQVRVTLPEQEPLSNLTRYSLYLLSDVLGWTIKIVFEAALEVIRTDIRLVPCETIESEDHVGTPQWILDSTSIDNGEARICFQQPHDSCTYRIDTRCVAAQIKAWLENCKSLHQSCSGRRESCDKRQHPFRLLFLGDENAPYARLVDANTADSKTEYVTMSHRWDSSTKATETTRANISDAYQNISLDAYPQHFKEAISLTKRLGFKYMWVDSLCIIQDCRKDWLKQATLMHQIYSSGRLNLALLQSFTHQEPTGQAHTNAEVLGCNVPLLDSNGLDRNLICWKPENFDHVLEKSSLYSRGWTFQERVLSLRTVHFGKQLYWECCSLRASTTFPSSVDYPCNFVDDSVLKFKQLSLNPGEDVAGTLHRTWCSVVRDYSKRDFTEPSDRLIALSGVAKRLRQVYSLSEDEYLYGLWKPCLPEQLLWGIETDQRFDTKQTNAGPSWSWVSHMHSSRFMSTHLGSEFLRERLATVIGFPDVKEEICCANLNASFNNAWANMSLSGILIPFDSSISTAITIEFDCCLCERGSNIYLLPILGDLGTIYGLVLQSVSVEESVAYSCSAFRRLGLFQSYQTTIEEMLYKQQPCMPLSLDWVTLRDLQGSTLTLVS